MDIRPDYYRGDTMECWDIIDKFSELAVRPQDIFYVGVVIKYLYRYMTKQDTSDIYKAITYLRRMIGMTEE